MRRCTTALREAVVLRTVSGSVRWSRLLLWVLYYPVACIDAVLAPAEQRLTPAACLVLSVHT
jgi:hypothetical protein